MVGACVIRPHVLAANAIEGEPGASLQQGPMVSMVEVRVGVPDDDPFGRDAFGLEDVELWDTGWCT